MGNKPEQQPSRLTIQVKGTGRVLHTAEQCTLDIRVSATGTDRAEISKTLETTSNRLHAQFDGLAPKDANGKLDRSASVTRFWMSELSTNANVRYSYADDDKPPMYRSSCKMAVVFRDFVKLAEVASELSKTPDVTIERSAWNLTTRTQAALASDARKLALRDAISIATDYAEVTGKKVTPVSINGTGSSNTSLQTFDDADDGDEMGFAIWEEDAVSAVEKTGIVMEAQEIEITSSVHVTFMEEISSEPELEQ